MSIETEVAALTVATTALTTAVNVKKSVLDAATVTATNQADTATNQASNASASATTATAGAATATTQATAATTQATNAAASAATALAAATASGNTLFYGTYALATAALAGLEANRVVRVVLDETKGYGSTWYQKQAGVFVFLMADVRLGTDPNLAPANYMLGTAAYLNQTWRSADFAVDPPSVATGAEYVATLAMPGAVLGDFVQISTSIDTLGIYVDVRVSGSDTLKAHYRNLSGAAIDLPSHTVSIRLMAKTPD